MDQMENLQIGGDMSSTRTNNYRVVYAQIQLIKLKNQEFGFKSR